ncbi:Na(+)-translocating NADH-quinone reductase subunit A [Candidatus Uabimicrobium amorphum]|uniref:Na(+)-translocating NADH-quinone reductase subunit A n=1 Tax=Uabimicrobium amorphum TaxID=2596890 RepID=A0A5S9INF3_UABAM|nr:Na(+)-translocating NADH-quinone reductase subunit A [Candidatus Uabimicrobium amorphum]BBM85123.1 Na(+)-translocating NADH-quinone reductase subunit A [Candidatus Uabimicrobium amorphum]
MANPIKIKKGLNLPITGEPEQAIKDEPKITTVALLGEDYVGMKPTMQVKVGDKVKKGQIIFTDKKLPDVNYTAPGAGEVIEINRGAKRVFQSVVIRLEGDEEVTFKSYSSETLKDVQQDQIQKILLKSGTWTCLRTRPYSKVADPNTKPHSIFVTAIDTNPLAPSVDVIVKESEEDFKNGLRILCKLTDGKVFLCTGANSSVPGKDVKGVTHQEFTGKHPAGNVGTHIHLLDPVGAAKTVWHINYQDVIMYGKLFTTGKLYTDRIISFAGPAAKSPRLIKTRIGASVADMAKDQVQDGEVRLISGSVFSGRNAQGPFQYLGRYHHQVSVLAEGREREFMGWHSPGFNKFSFKNIYFSKLFPGKKFAFNTSTNGSKRALVPIGSYEKVMPFDFLPTLLLRSLLAGDTDRAQVLGCLELDEEDLALCSFVCPGKINFGPALRKSLTTIEKDG